MNKYTDKDSYQFGDLTKEILKRIATGQYTMDDLFMLLKALAIFEASISPVGKPLFQAFGVATHERRELTSFVYIVDCN